MKKRPNPFWHMMSWGMGSGFILALSFIIIINDLVNLGDHVESMLSPLISRWYLAFILGAVPGGIMGFVLALVLWGLLRNVPLPFTGVEMNRKRIPVSIASFSMTFLLSSIIFLVLFGLFFGYIVFIPPFIAPSLSVSSASMESWHGKLEVQSQK